MAKDTKTITLWELPEISEINDSDIFTIADGNETHKITGKNLILYIQNHDNISKYYVHQDTVGSANGLASLDGNKKILSENIPFGSQTGSVYEGASGKALEMEVGTKAGKTELDSHVTDQTSHITSTERSSWNDSNAKKHAHSNKSVLDGITAPLISGWNNAAAHISDSAKHIAGSERALWNTVNDKVSKVDGKTLSSNDFSNAAKAKLQGIESGANLYRHPDADGSRHIPANGTTNGGKYLKATSTAGNYKWENLTKADVESALGYTPSGSESVTYRLSKSGSDIILTGSDGSITSITDSDTTYSLSDFGITSSSAEINQLKGVKSNVQTQLNNVYTKNEANTLLNDKLAKAGDGSNLTAAFTEAPTLATINTGEKLSVIMGKVKKAITALLSHTGTTATASVSGHVKVDSALNSASTNPVQNQTVNAALAGKLSTAGDASNTTVAYTEAAALSELASGEKLSAAFGKLKLAVKNVMSIVKLLGSTDISAIGGGTVTGALAAINSNFAYENVPTNSIVPISVQNMSSVQLGASELPEGYYTVANAIKNPQNREGVQYAICYFGGNAVGKMFYRTFANNAVTAGFEELALNGSIDKIGASCAYYQSNSSTIANTFIPMQNKRHNTNPELYYPDASGILITEPGTYVVMAGYHILLGQGDTVSLSFDLSIDKASNNLAACVTQNSGATYQHRGQISTVIRTTVQDRVLLRMETNNGSSYVFATVQSNACYISITKIK